MVERPALFRILRLDGMSRTRIAGLCFVFGWFLIGGVAHFMFTELEMRIVPPYVPWPREAVLVSGVFELFGAAGLVWWRTRRFAGIGLFVLTLAVTPCHFYMLQRPDLFDVPYWLLVLRLPIQAFLLELIWWSSKRVTR
ncbi:MAG: hypothetical protein WBP11_06485 [Dokdonella sp.]